MLARMASFCVHLLPALVAPDQLAGGTVVVVDILRATTTMVHALAAGAREIRPCLEVEEARALAAQLGENAVLGGERHGRPIAGFHLGNSPAEYSPEKVRGKTVVFSTTNGTRALLRCTQAAEVLIGSFVNLSAVCHAALRSPNLHVLCAGTDGQITREDVLFAGAVAAEWELVSGQVAANDAAGLALDAWRQVRREWQGLTPLAEPLRHSHGGRNLVEIGCERDIAIAAEVDKFDLVPRFHAAAGCVALDSFCVTAKI